MGQEVSSPSACLFLQETWERSLTPLTSETFSYLVTAKSAQMSWQSSDNTVADSLKISLGNGI